MRTWILIFSFLITAAAEARSYRCEVSQHQRWAGSFRVSTNEGSRAFLPLGRGGYQAFCHGMAVDRRAFLRCGFQTDICRDRCEAPILMHATAEVPGDASGLKLTDWAHLAEIRCRTVRGP